MLNKLGWLSINQLSCEIRLIEVWKALNQENHCLSNFFEKATADKGITRSAGLNKLKAHYKSSFILEYGNALSYLPGLRKDTLL